MVKYRATPFSAVEEKKKQRATEQLICGMNLSKDIRCEIVRNIREDMIGSVSMFAEEIMCSLERFQAASKSDIDIMSKMLKMIRLTCEVCFLTSYYFLLRWMMN